MMTYNKQERKMPSKWLKYSYGLALSCVILTGIS